MLLPLSGDFWIFLPDNYDMYDAKQEVTRQGSMLKKFTYLGKFNPNFTKKRNDQVEEIKCGKSSYGIVNMRSWKPYCKLKLLYAKLIITYNNRDVFQHIKGHL